MKIIEHRLSKNMRGRLSSGLAGLRKEAPKAQVVHLRKGAIILLQEGVALIPYKFAQFNMPSM